MKLGMATRLLFILLDMSGSMEDDKYVVNACNSLLSKDKEQLILVTVAYFGSHNEVDIRYLYKLLPIFKCTKLSLSAMGGSPIWRSVVESFKEIKLELIINPITTVDFVIVSDMHNEREESYTSACKKTIADALEHRWKLTCLCPKDGRDRAIHYSREINFPEDRIMEVTTK